MSALDDAFDTYILDCSTRLAPPTYRWYQEKLTRFVAWMREEGKTLDDLRPSLVNRFILTLQTTPSPRTGKPLTTHTVHGYGEVVKTFVKWCETNDYLSGPERKIKLPGVTQKVIETFSATQLKQMIASCTHEETEWLAQRDRAILFTLLDTGIRASELCTLQIDHVHLQEGYLRVRGKGDKWREVGFGANTKYHLVKWLRRYRPKDAQDETVFIGKRRDHLTVSGLDQMLYRIGEWAGVKGVRCSAHTFRHTFAINFLLRGGDMYALKTALGHTSVSTTEIYLRASKAQDMRKLHVSVADNLLV